MITCRPPLAVTLDLDDTVFAQRVYLDEAWRAVAAAAGRHSIPGQPLRVALAEIAAEGSDRGRIIDRALARCGVEALPGLVADLVAAFRGFRPASLPAYPGVPERLRELREYLPVGCITDGDPSIQRAKIAALGLGQAFDTIVISDEIGRQFRKPHAAPFRAALSALGVAPEDAIHVGDRPEKDIAGPHRLGMRAIRVRTGEYAGAPDGTPPPDFAFSDAASALAALRDLVAAGGRRAPAESDGWLLSVASRVQGGMSYTRAGVIRRRAGPGRAAGAVQADAVPGLA